MRSAVTSSDGSRFGRLGSEQGSNTHSGPGCLQQASDINFLSKLLS